jgi:hypothetical protein
MIKNQLYPYIETYFNEYLWGFTKEQFKVGVMNGTILLEKINLRSDKVNEKLDSQEIPIWLKAGAVKMIKVACSLMNFIGEKPLEMIIEDVDIILTCSSKWVLKNKSSYIEENENHIRDVYDPTDNNSHDVFSKKINIYDGSILKEKARLLEVFSDKSKITELINKIFTKAVRFYYQKVFMVNFTIKNVHVRFEDDVYNYFGNTAFGLKIGSITGSLSADGVIKKNSIKAEKINMYWEPNPTALIPSKVFYENLDISTNTINEKYYDYLKTVKFNTVNKNSYNLLKDLNVICNFGLQLVESGQVDFFSGNKPKNLKFYVQIATSDVNLNVYPEMLKKTKSLTEVLRTNYLIENVQDYKPMRKPYSNQSKVVRNNVNDPNLKVKRKLVARDWLYYLVWFNRFKKAVYGKIHANPVNEEFGKYYNICCLSNEEEKEDPENSIIFKKDSNKDKKPLDVGELNPENITLTVLGELLVKSVNLSLFSQPDKDEYITIKINNISNKCHIQKDKFEFSFDLKEMTVNGKSCISVNKNLLDSDNISHGGVSDYKDFDSSSIGFHDSFVNVQSLGSTYNSNASKANTSSHLNKKVSILHQTLDKLSSNANTARPTVVPSKPQNNKSITNVFFDDNVGTAAPKKTHRLDLTKELNDYNRKHTTVNSRITHTIHTVNSIIQEKIALNMLEVLPLNNTGINAKYVKSSINHRISDSFNTNIGGIRINLTEEQVNKTMLVLSDYVRFNKFGRLKHLKLYNFKYHGTIYTMRRTIHDRLTKQINSKKGNSNIESYRNYLIRELKNYNHELIKDGKFEINYLFNILNKSNLQVSINYSDLIISTFSIDMGKNVQPIGKLKIPKLNFHLNLNRERISLRFFEFDFEYYDLEKWRQILNNTIINILERFKFKKTTLEPIMKALLDDRRNTIDESKVTEPILHNPKFSSKQKFNLQNIIENNLATGKAMFLDTKSKHSSQIDVSNESFYKQNRGKRTNNGQEESVFEIEKEFSNFHDEDSFVAGNKHINKSSKNMIHVRIPTLPNKNTLN